MDGHLWEFKLLTSTPQTPCLPESETLQGASLPSTEQGR